MIKNHSVFTLLCKPIYIRQMIVIGIPNWILLLNGFVSYKMISTKSKQIAFLLKEPVFNVQDVDIIYVVSLSTTVFFMLYYNTCLF